MLLFLLSVHGRQVWSRGAKAPTLGQGVLLPPSQWTGGIVQVQVRRPRDRFLSPCSHGALSPFLTCEHLSFVLVVGMVLKGEGARPEQSKAWRPDAAGFEPWRRADGSFCHLPRRSCTLFNFSLLYSSSAAFPASREGKMGFA